MKAVIYIIGSFILLGGVGMFLANRSVDKQIANSRWIKYISYLLITGAVIASIFLDWFPYIAIIIVVSGLIELISAIDHKKVRPLFGVLTFIVFITFSGFFLGFAFLVVRDMVFYLYLQVIVFDAFCQVTGQLFGRRKLVPRISPSKTIEGLMGGSIFCLLTALVLANHFEISPIKSLLIGMVVIIASLSGDLLASWFKRKMGIKDFSNLLPGQGGFLDRFDSFIVTGGICFAVAIFSTETFWTFLRWA